jgi:signal transduction histidine kinase
MQPARRDLLLAAVLPAAAEAELLLGRDAAGGARAAGIVAALALGALTLRRPRPASVLTVIVGAMVVQAAVGGILLEGVVPLVAVAIAAFSVGARRGTRATIAIGAGAAAGLTLANQLDASTTASALNDLVFYSLLAIGAPAALGRGWRVRTDAIAALRERRTRLARDEELVLAAARVEEGARLARSVHAAIAQRVGEIALQAAGAERMATVEPARTLESLGRIEATAREALEELREIIGVLRTPGGEAGR